MVDCEKNGCHPPHSDDGRVLSYTTQSTDENLPTTINGHACTTVIRSVVRAPWRPVAEDG